MDRVLRYHPLINLGLAAALILNSLNGQASSVEQKKLSPQQLKDFLRKPNGLEKAAAIARTLVVQDQRPLFARLSLDSLVRESDLVLVGTVMASRAALSSDGDSIFSTYDIHVGEILKGQVGQRVIQLEMAGGVVKFDNGTSAEVVTVLEKRIDVGQRDLFFLRGKNLTELALINAEESVIKLPGQNGIVDPASSHDGSPHHPINDDVRSIRSDDLIAKVRELSR